MTNYAVEPMEIPLSPSLIRTKHFPCAGYTAWDETTPSTHAKWDLTRIAIRHVSMKPNNTILPDGPIFRIHPNLRLSLRDGTGGRDRQRGKGYSTGSGQQSHLWICLWSGHDFRDLQIAMREKGRPWEVGGIRESAPCAVQPASKVGHTVDRRDLAEGEWETKQSADIAD